MVGLEILFAVSSFAQSPEKPVDLALQRVERTTPATSNRANLIAAIASSIVYQLKPYWRAPDGEGSDKIRTVVSIELNADGSLSKGPTFARQEGVTDANRELAAEHRKRALESVQKAAPFKVPPEHHPLFKHITMIFDRRM